MPILRENDNLSDNFEFYNNKKSALETLKIKEDNIDLICKYLNTEIHARDMLSRHTSKRKLFENKLLSFLEEFKFSDPKFVTNISVSNIKYNHPKLQINNPFYFFHD